MDRRPDLETLWIDAFQASMQDVLSQCSMGCGAPQALSSSHENILERQQIKRQVRVTMEDQEKEMLSFI